jgi:P27 family predicted phage terminase small subunit
MRGRPRKPAELKLVAGNVGHHPIVFGPSFSPGFGSCPKHIRGEGRKLWKTLTGELTAQGLDAKPYRGMLESVCYWYNEWRELIHDIQLNGRTYTISETGYTAPRPEVVQAQKAWVNYKNASVEFGFTPASNGKVTAPKTKKQSLKDSIMGSKRAV